MEPAYEKLGAFYLGGLWDREGGARPDRPLLYDAKDLTTHAVCVGMTGSGKTGLCVSLLEEAAIDGVPAIAIDPKGDLANLLLAFPDLRPQDFEPWVDPAAAERKGQTVAAFAADRAELWRSGLAEWNQGPERVARFRDAVDVAVYTPGSNAGLPLRVLGSFTAPSPEVLHDGDALRDRVQATVSGLLALLGIDADPIRSREQILLANILHRAWSEGADLALAGLIRAIQSPPFESIGVMDLESFYPAKERFGLAMSLNNLLASPGFAAWMEGEPLDAQRLLYTPQGKPRLTIVSIAHLSDAERMFFVTLLLNEVVAWMREQRGTSSLRALLYMDEVFGYLPPTANPPSKLPLLTLLKQARAFGLGVVLATQNPVDLDYKALSNAGTWFLGRLQTERDKARVLDGLEGASTAAGQAFDRRRTEATLSGLTSRVFLMNNVHEEEPVLFHTRWALSYLAGPLTRSQISELMAARKERSPARPPPAAGARTGEGTRPVLPAAVPEFFVSARAGDGRVVYRPALVGAAKLHYTRARPKVDVWRDAAVLAPLDADASGDPWETAEVLEGGLPELDREPVGEATYDALPPRAAREKSYTTWERALKTHLYRSRALTVWKCADLRLSSEAGESEDRFRARLRQAAREKRDESVEKLRRKYAPKLHRMEDRVRRAEQRVEREKAQYEHQKSQTAISFGTTILSALFGRRKLGAGTVGRAGTALRGVSRSSREKHDIARAQENVQALREQMAELETEFEEALEELQDDYEPESLEVAAIAIKPRKADISVERVALVWTPWRTNGDGALRPAYG